MQNRIKILIVEDEMLIAANIAIQLETLGYEVAGIIPRGEEAIKTVQHEKPDLVLMDINLKGAWLVARRMIPLMITSTGKSGSYWQGTRAFCSIRILPPFTVIPNFVCGGAILPAWAAVPRSLRH